LHFLSHYRHCRNRKETIAELSAPMTIGSFTTISAFLGLSFMHTPVLQQLGVFTAFNLIGSSLCTLIFLPHFVGSRENHAHKKNWIDRLAGFRPEKRKGILILILIITAVLSLYIDRVRFDEDMLKMNYMRADLKEAQQLIQQQNSESLNSMFCVSEGPTLNAALYKSRTSAEQLEQLKKEQLIRRYSSPSRFIPDSVSAKTKLAYWNRYWTLHNKDAFISQCRFAAERNGFSAQALDGLEHILSKSYVEPDPNLITGFKKLFTALWTEDKDGVKIIQWIRCNQENRNLLIERMKHTESSYLIDRQMLTSAWVDVIRKDFYNILFLTSFIVFFTILLSYGRIEIAIISFLPMVITWFCILGLMGILHIEFNIINVIISTLIFGLGDDYSIFITDGLLEKYRYGTSRIQSVKTSVYLSAITTILGLGILIFAKHPALKSIALVSVIGILCILFISQTLQPFLFSIFIQNRSDRKQYPFTFWSLLKSVFAFTYYLVGCILVTLVGFILTRCIPFARYRMKYIYHVIICKMMWSLLYIMASVKKKIENRHYSDFNTPAVLIANHSSFLDLLRIISLHPKILLLTNRWVWRSPVFGALVRMADYYPVEEGAEFSVDKLKEWTDRGYSIAVFPEGTRSYTDEIKRFHKGAFYIAEKLQLDIQPILFQGIGHSMRKGDFLLKDTEINISFLPRIKPNDTTFGTGYSERARRIGKYFREEHKKYSLEKETPAYYRTQLIHSFIYKGPVLEWYCRIKTRIEKNYERIESLIGKEDHILDIGCGYGFLDFILHWTGPERTIRAIDYDEEKIAMAQHIALRNETLQFESTDLLHFTTQQS
ncbi:MAG TPA: 1-acyl-sn-glycerol-3-phosphate acyltransferase, partial [Chitinophagaceae bacterium]|nr:1-acyl-sn-glycerol-3-phosphate acyltransferase [Chitinophagaceae bacterium]